MPSPRLKLNYRSAALRVCVDRTEGGRVQGRVVSQRLREPLLFTDVSDLLLKLDALLDLQDFPQSFHRPRAFSPKRIAGVPAALAPEEMSPPETVDAAQGGLDTFQLYVSTRHNSTWQGFVDWLDDTPRQTFSSTLELMKALDQKYLITQG